MVKGRRLTQSILTGALAVGLLGCVSNQLSPEYKNKVARLTQLIKKQQLQIDELKNENNVLKQGATVGGSKNKVEAFSGLDEKELYKEVVRAYRQQQEVKLKQLHQELISKYPTSTFADNATYLAGELNFSMGDYGESIKYFDNVVKSYPKGNKRMAALLGKARAYDKLNLKKRASGLYAEVIKFYPGSPEAKTAMQELAKVK